MAKTLPQVITDQKILRKKSEPVLDINNSEIQEIIEDMLQILKIKEGAGLAAPQIGKFFRIFIANLERNIYIFINPKIIKVSNKKRAMEEGCLSVPGVYLNIERPAKIAIEAADRHGKKFKLKAGGILSRVIQHEIDHLEGILITDK